MKLVTKNILMTASALLALGLLSSCTITAGTYSGNGGDTVYYPYETVYGDACKGSEPTPGCTFSTKTGQRVTVSSDPAYNQAGYGSDDMWYVTFDSQGRAAVYNDLGQFQYYADISQFAGYVGGNSIEVGTSGLYWESVSNKT